MANVNIKFNNKDYLLACDDGQEENLKELASHLDAKYNDLKKNLGNIGDSKLLLITAIQMVDDYFDLNNKINSKKNDFEKLSIKFNELRSLAINYKDEKEKEIEKLKDELNKFEEMIEESKNSSIYYKIKAIIDLLDDARQLGTPQFSRMARLAFIGNQYLKALVKKNVITEQDSDIYLANIDTIASELKKDFDSVLKNKLTIDEFKSIYGHLRPGTYDIRKLPYTKDSSYFSTNTFVKVKSKQKKKRKKNLVKFRENITTFLEDFEISLKYLCNG